MMWFVWAVIVLTLLLCLWLLLILGGGIHHTVPHPCGDPNCDEDHGDET